MLPRLTINTYRSLAILVLAILLASQFAPQFATGAMAADPEYLTAVADLPLPAGLVEDVDAGISFDKPEGRIVEAIARGSVPQADVAAFYRSSLPGLGWRRLDESVSGSRWQRGGETLSVDIVDGGNPLVVRFSIAPN